MKLNLTKPLIVFDLETTGLDMIKDRIIQISYIKVMPDGTEDRKNLFVNPCKEIPAEVVALTGISNEDVKDAPTFKQLAATLEKEFTGCDFAGYNSNHFDVPMLAEEFLRAGIDFDFNKCRLIDAQTIFMKMERRNLAAAYKFYCGRKMEEDFEAHRADQDTEATYRVLMGELDKYAPGVQDEPERVLNNNMDELAEFSKQKDNVDFAGRIVWEGNQRVFDEFCGLEKTFVIFGFIAGFVGNIKGRGRVYADRSFYRTFHQKRSREKRRGFRNIRVYRGLKRAFFKRREFLHAAHSRGDLRVWRYMRDNSVRGIP